MRKGSDAIHGLHDQRKNEGNGRKMSGISQKALEMRTYVLNVVSECIVHFASCNCAPRSRTDVKSKARRIDMLIDVY